MLKVFNRMRCLVVPLMSVLAGGVLSLPLAAQSPPRTVFVHLFEWKWTDIAQECEQFLGPKGFAAVQVSPPQEHAIVPGRPWWQRYQPVSYRIESRSGSRQQFAEMVSRCAAAGVDIYVDAVINHMTAQEGTATGSAGSVYSHYDYPGTYAWWDFHYCGRNGNDDIANYQDAWEVQNCELLNLADLDTGSSYVRGRIAGYLNDLVGLGVKGFRIDAAKHMSPNDIGAILAQVQGTPYIYQEVIDRGGEPVSAAQYFQNGDITEFKYGRDLGATFKTGQLAWFNGVNQFGEAWGFMPSDKAVVFVDNHDNQRGHGSGGVITYKDGTLYDLANVFMLAWPYGYPQIMSSYDFSDTDQGPPEDGNGHTLDVHNSDGTVNCFAAQWKCEHRWRPIANMVEFHNVTASDFFISNWWDNGGNQIAFGRGNKGFVVINKESAELARTFQTGLAAGEYCNVIEGDFDGSVCSGPSITVNSNGEASFSVAPWRAAAIHVGARVGSQPAVTVTFNVHAPTHLGENVFVVGNLVQLGSWDPDRAILLSAAAHPIWSGSLQLPPSASVEYKYIRKEGGAVVWESGANRTFTSPAAGSMTRNDSWR